MKHIALITVIALLYLLFGCKNENTEDETEIKKSKSKNIKKHSNDSINISILLDLSDRISNPHQKENDLEHVLNIAKIFKHHVQNKKTILLEDHLQVFFEPNPSPGMTNEIATQLKFNITKITVNDIETIEKNFTEYPSQLYEWALENPNTKKGADIWRFFKDNVADYCLEEDHRNILIILTDGYLYHEGSIMKKGKKTTRINQRLLNDPMLNKYDWKTEVEKNNMGILWDQQGILNDLEILVLGIDTHESKSPYAVDIIKYYWSRWFEEMGVQKFKIKGADNPAHIEKVIQDFINS